MKRPVADGNKLFLWREVLVLLDRSLLPEGSDWNSVCPGWEESATIFLARLRVLEVAVAAAYQIVIEEVRMDSMMAV